MLNGRSSDIYFFPINCSMSHFMYQIIVRYIDKLNRYRYQSIYLVSFDCRDFLAGNLKDSIDCGLTDLKTTERLDSGKVASLL
jgi:hypothetical protein